MQLFKGKQKKRFAKFLIVGVISTIVDFGFMNLFTLVFDIPLIIAQGLSFTIAVAESYLLNRFWIYPDSRNKSVYKQLLLFVLINLVGVGIRTLLIPWMDALFLKWLTGVEIGVLMHYKEIFSQNMALALVVGIVLLWNFFANRYLTFSDVDDE